MKRLWLLYIALGFLLLVACQGGLDPFSPDHPSTLPVTATSLVMVHDYTNVSIDSGHYLLPEGYAGASVAAYAGPFYVGRGGALPNCPYDDTWTGGQYTPTPQGHAEAFDRLWYQIIGFSASVTFDLGGPYNQIYISLNQDHGPYPEEALEYRVAVSNNLAGPYTTLPVNTPITVYQGGWSTAGEYDGDCNANGVLNDDYSALWYLPGFYRYVRLTPIADTGSYNEPEIDAVAGIGPNVKLDIHPQSCPNPINYKSKGVMPAAILGTEEFDVTEVDVSTILLEGVAPIRWSIEDVSSPSPSGDLCDCTTEGFDGFDDLTLKFETQEIVASIGPAWNGTSIELTITGQLLNGTPFEAIDCVLVVGSSDKMETTDQLKLEDMTR